MQAGDVGSDGYAPPDVTQEAGSGTPDVQIVGSVEAHAVVKSKR